MGQQSFCLYFRGKQLFGEHIVQCFLGINYSPTFFFLVKISYHLTLELVTSKRSTQPHPQPNPIAGL